jgi:hypothetical protein
MVSMIVENKLKTRFSSTTFCITKFLHKHWQLAQQPLTGNFQQNARGSSIRSYEQSSSLLQTTTYRYTHKFLAKMQVSVMNQSILE